ncbi:NADPH-dependent 2,4-dienoyl-CoA reductase, sulfur reductase [Polaromonas sp. OV174]|uniref:NAD(P)/FAD-dependent oxidoreductase n=1 Tax=Polaromonas sp. OV174 TaxID=1855300 RepID=UPI0008EB3324|nr:FAD/NAD(P)-binding oxidoreductase [Polaromonas sp. OV174]SFB77221.1 NADPH-dependent 2,4-dienoyl-CoA reductase, sulfur reductase [Polaromonas sp. OV174]
MNATISEPIAPILSSPCELLIVGAGPAGLAAALAAAPSGARITLLDDNPAPGGQIWRAGPAVRLPPQALRLREALARCANVRVLCGTRVVGLVGERELLLEDPERGWVQRYDKLILCTGARELLLPFPGWTLPGVTGAGALQALIKSGLPVAGERIVIAGSGPLLLAVAATARKCGAQVIRVAEQASLSSLAAFTAQLARWPGKAIQALTLVEKSYRTSSNVVSAQGNGRVESVRLQQGAKVIDIACDRIACGFGLIPNTQLGQLLGCLLASASGGAQGLAFDAFQATSVPDVYAAGECTGFGGSERALTQGRIAGHAAVGNIAAAQRCWPERARWEAFANQLHRRFALAESLKQIPRPDTLICRCEDVPHNILTQCSGWIDAKLHSRCGMGACQGRVCGAAAQFLYGWEAPVPRSPLSPARIATLASPLNSD